MKLNLLIITVLLMGALLSSLANAQVFYAAPPAGFDPTKASPAELDRYGLPPRPDPSKAVPYAAWLHLVTAPQTRIENPTVEITNIVNGPARDLKVQGKIKGNVSGTSSNWSGVAITNPSNAFTANNSAVYSEFVMPKMGVDNCTYGKYYFSWWVGFDGDGSGDVLQAGAASTACTPSYVLWYEWFESGCTSSSATHPCNQTNFKGIPVTAGDWVGVEVWYTTASPQGHAYVLNYTTQKSVTIGFSQPSGTATYDGNSVEWIAERPTVGGSLADLADYLGQGSVSDYAYDGTNYYYPDSAPAADTIYDLTMTCPTWNPSSACTSTTNISYPIVPGNATLWTIAEGPAVQ
jgi:hypothetical protein